MRNYAKRGGEKAKICFIDVGACFFVVWKFLSRREDFALCFADGSAALPLWERGVPLGRLVFAAPNAQAWAFARSAWVLRVLFV
jgi:hypothetical protein